MGKWSILKQYSFCDGKLIISKKKNFKKKVKNPKNIQKKFENFWKRNFEKRENYKEDLKLYAEIGKFFKKFKKYVWLFDQKGEYTR